MSTSPEQEASASSTNCTTAPQPHRTTTTQVENKEKDTQKTISCVSCRRRKLKCDRIKPKCATCVRLRYQCEYPERRRNTGTKRRNMKELEARLAQVETQLVAETQQMANKDKGEMNVNGNGNANANGNGNTGVEMDWGAMDMNMNMNLDMDMNMDMNFTNEGLQDLGFDIMNGNLGTASSVPTVPIGDFFSQEIISLGLQEPLPPESLMDDLYRIYFERFHPTLPMIHKGRFFSALNMPANHKPPIALRYAMMMVAASLSDDYNNYAEIFYERARRYAEITEMKGQGEAFVCIQSVQTWSIISNYEATNAFFSRAWMSTGRCARLCHMLSLQRLDAEGGFAGKRILPPPKDWIELEERRRTFWAAYYGDRWSSCATGWPMMFDESKIKTNLPCSNDAFDLGMEEKTCSLAESLTPEGASTISSFAGVVLSACLFGQNTEHMFKSGPDQGTADIANGEFWKRHRKMDNVLSSTFMFLPDHLRLPAGLRDPNVVFFHMNIHCSIICLHQGAVLTAEREDISQSFIQQSEARSLMAAEEITGLMRMMSHMNVSKMSSWVGFCLYVASGVILQDCRKPNPSPQSSSNLEFMMAAMKAVGKKYVIARHFAAQLELEIDTNRNDRMDMVNKIYDIKNHSHIDGSLAEEDENLCIFPRTFKRRVTRAPENNSSRNSIDTGVSTTTSINANTPPQTTNTAQTQIDVSQATSTIFAPLTANLPSNPNPQPQSFQPPNFLSNLQSFTQGTQDSGSESLDNTDFSWPPTGNTPSSDSSTSNIPYRNTKSGVTPPDLNSNGNGNGNTNTNPNWIFDPDATRFTVDPLALNVRNGNTESELRDNELLNSLLNGAPWDTNFHHLGRGRERDERDEQDGGG